VPTDWNNVAPRLGFAYLANDKLAIRGGAGVYYGMSVATNYQYPGADCFDIEPARQCAATLLRYHVLNSQWVKLVSRILEVLQAGLTWTSL
jgi:hypothetical protein